MNERTMDYEVIPFSDELFRIRILSDMVTTPEMRAAVCRWHEQLEILYVTDGTLVCECDFEDYTCTAGDIVVINPCEAHTVCYADAPSHYHCLMVDPGLYSSRGDISGIKYTEPISERRIRFNHVIRNDRARMYLLRLLDEYAVGEPAYEMAVKGNLLCLLAELFRNELADDLTKNSGGRSGVSPALRYIAEHYAEDIALDDLASLCCMNRSYFCRRFRDVTGKTAIGYLNEYRLTKARALLMSTDRSVTDIARDAGFSDSSYFARLFVRCYGVSPREMRSDGTGI